MNKKLHAFLVFEMILEFYIIVAFLLPSRSPPDYGTMFTILVSTTMRQKV